MNNPYEFNRGLEMPTDNSFKPKPMVRYSVPTPPTKKVVKEEPTDVAPIKEPVKTSFILDELDDDDLDEVPQAVNLTAKEIKDLEVENEPEPEVEIIDEPEDNSDDNQED
jgi:hypothetical protein